MNALIVRIVLLSGLCVAAAARDNGQVIPLPQPATDGAFPLEQAIAARRTVRRFDDAPLTLAHLGQLLWSAQGITDSAGYRSAPSAGALYPLELFIVAGAVETLRPGVYWYRASDHTLNPRLPGDQTDRIAQAALEQDWIGQAPATLVFTGVRARTAAKYGMRSDRYIAMEAGHAAQNVSLQCVALGLGSAVVGGFLDDGVRNVLGLPRDHTPLLLMPIGRVRGE